MAITSQSALDDATDEPAVLVVVGLPAAGKSTITDILSDIGVDVIDTGDAMRSIAADQLDDPSEDEIWDWVSEQRDVIGPHAPTQIALDEVEYSGDVIVVSSCRAQEEVDWIRGNVGPTLVMKVEASPHTRSRRYIEDRINDSKESISRERELELREELYDREHREAPYPDHDISVINENSVSMQEIYTRMENLVSVLRA